MVACGLPDVPKGKPEARMGKGQGVGLCIDCTAPPVARQGESVRAAAVNVRLTAEDFAELDCELPGWLGLRAEIDHTGVRNSSPSRKLGPAVPVG